MPETSKSALVDVDRAWPWHPTTLFLLGLLGSSTAGLVGAGVAWLINTLLGNSPILTARATAWGAVGGVAAGLATTLLMAALFAWHNNREDVRLVEAASPLHPLLKQLMVRAPGTYAHSLAVANLAEAGADAIGADSLLARVGAYYHDVGKIRRPCFFFENQADGDNPHEQAKPRLSTDIITAHVEDGLEMAERYELPEPVCDIIGQHHGNSLVRYFYHKASQSDAAVYEADFRYRGQRPRSPEAALVMLADASEAAVRALDHPTEERVKSVVRSVLDERVEDGQLQESGLSDADYEAVVTTFTRQLVGISHARCEYPDLSDLRRGDVRADQRAEPA